MTDAGEWRRTNGLLSLAQNPRYNTLMHFNSNPRRTVLICLAAEALNLLTVLVFQQTLHVSLFLDTIFTVAVTFYLGLLPGLCVALAYNVLDSVLLVARGITAESLLFLDMLYALCGLLIVLVTWIIARNRDEFRISAGITVLYLVLIALVSSFCSIVTSGLIDFIRIKYFEVPDIMRDIKHITDSFVERSFPLYVSCIIAQIPMSVADRFVTTFAGYGVYRLMERWLGEERSGR